jgi:hypothetical protein
MEELPIEKLLQRHKALCNTSTLVSTRDASEYRQCTRITSGLQHII